MPIFLSQLMRKYVFAKVTDRHHTFKKEISTITKFILLIKKKKKQAKFCMMIKRMNTVFIFVALLNSPTG